MKINIFRDIEYNYVENGLQLYIHVYVIKFATIDCLEKSVFQSNGCY